MVYSFSPCSFCVRANQSSTGNRFPAITIKERGDGSLLVQYPAPFIEDPPPPLITRLNGDGELQENAWQGTQVRIGIMLPTGKSNPDNPMLFLWPNIPSNVGAVIFPKRWINALKSEEGFSGEVNLLFQHRDSFNNTRWVSNTLPYTFANRYPVD